jgi:hypothetical protein
VVNAALPPRRLAANGRVVAGELAWLEAVMSARFAAYGGQGGEGETPPEPPGPPSLARASGPYAELVRELNLAPAERLVLALALAPYLAPAALDPFLLTNQATGRRFTEFGGLTGQSHAGFLPSAETALFLLAGEDRAARLAFDDLFAPDAPLVRRGVLVVDLRHPDEPPLAGALRVSAPGMHLLLKGAEFVARASADFPATPITTPLEWRDLVLDARVSEQVEMIVSWQQHRDTLMDEWGLSRRLKPGYRCLFYGGPGTGKTLTAALIGKRVEVPVYRVDLSRVVSKWIGETEKNLASLFDHAEHQNWILFFDEADALFGKRTDASSANDRHANQQIAYLLQRLEDFPGVVILATNQQSHFDEAFARRFQSAVLFPMPDVAQRERLWRETFGAARGVEIAADIDFARIARDHELAGGAIINVLRYAALMAVARTPPVIHAADLIDGIRRERQKDGQYVSR